MRNSGDKFNLMLTHGLRLLKRYKLLISNKIWIEANLHIFFILGHMVPWSEPKYAQDMFERFLDGTL